MVSSSHHAAGVNRRWHVDVVYRIAGPHSMVSAHESWCDTRLGISTCCNCMARPYWRSAHATLLEASNKELDRCRSIAEQDAKDYAEIREKLAIAVEAMWFSLRGIAMWEKYQSPGNIKEIKEAMRGALEKLKEKNK